MLPLCGIVLITGNGSIDYVATTQTLIASRIIPRPRSSGPGTALMKTGSVRKTSIIPWTILIPRQRTSPGSSSALFLPGNTLNSNQHGD